MESDKNADTNAMDRFGCLTFNKAAMKRFLSKAVFDKLLSVIENNDKLDAEIANEVAHGMKEWALSQGATHFTHWFQPMRGETAEKHDTFLSLDGEGNPIVRFSGAREEEDGPVVGRGAVLAAQIVAIAEALPDDEDEADEDDYGDEGAEDLEDEEENTQVVFLPVAPSEPAPAPAPAAVSDADLEGEGVKTS